MSTRSQDRLDPLDRTEDAALGKSANRAGSPAPRTPRRAKLAPLAGAAPAKLPLKVLVPQVAVLTAVALGVAAYAPLGSGQPSVFAAGSGTAASPTRELTVLVNGTSRTVRTSAQTVGQLLEEMGLKDKASANASLDTRLEDLKAPLELDAACEAIITSGNTSFSINTRAKTVGELLEKLGLELDEVASKAENIYSTTPISDGLRIPVRNLALPLTVDEEQKIPYRSEEVEDPSLAPGERRVVRTGQVGERKRTYRVEADRSGNLRRMLISTETIRKPVSEKVLVGPDADPSSPGENPALASSSRSSRAQAWAVGVSTPRGSQPADPSWSLLEEHGSGDSDRPTVSEAPGLPSHAAQRDTDQTAQDTWDAPDSGSSPWGSVGALPGYTPAQPGWVQPSTTAPTALLPGTVPGTSAPGGGSTASPTLPGAQLPPVLTPVPPVGGGGGGAAGPGTDPGTTPTPPVLTPTDPVTSNPAPTDPATEIPDTSTPAPGGSTPAEPTPTGSVSSESSASSPSPSDAASAPTDSASSAPAPADTVSPAPALSSASNAGTSPVSSSGDASSDPASSASVPSVPEQSLSVLPGTVPPS